MPQLDIVSEGATPMRHCARIRSMIGTPLVALPFSRGPSPKFGPTPPSPISKTTYMTWLG